MRTPCLLAAALWLAGIASAQAQRRIRIGPTYSSLSLEDQSGSSYSFPSYGGSVALLTGDESETGLTIARYNNLSTDHGIRRLTLYGLDSYYYPVGARGVVAPFALTALGLARVTEIDSLCLLSIISCNATAAATSQLALAFGLGIRVNVGGAAVATLAGRFLEVPGSQIQALEAVVNASVALGGVHKGQLLAGTLGPVVSAFIPISGPLRGRSPFAGVRFRRDTKRRGAWVCRSITLPSRSPPAAARPDVGPTPSSSRPVTKRRSGRRGAACTAWSVSSSRGSTRKGPIAAWRRGRMAASVPTSTAAGPCGTSTRASCGCSVTPGKMCSGCKWGRA